MLHDIAEAVERDLIDNVPGCIGDLACAAEMIMEMPVDIIHVTGFRLREVLTGEHLVCGRSVKVTRRQIAVDEVEQDVVAIVDEGLRRWRVITNAVTVGLYKLSSVDPWLDQKGDWA